MSDDEQTQKKRGYRLEYASSGRAKCKGPKPCQGNTITKGVLRFGSLVDFQGNKSFSWRHWGCVTAALLKNARAIHEDPSDLDGYEELSPEDQAKIDTAWEVGAVADEDIPDTARKAEADGQEPKAPAKKTKAADKDAAGEGAAPKRKRAPAKKKAKEEDLGFDAGEPAPKKRRSRKKVESEGEDADKAAEKPPAKRKAPAAKADAPKKAAAKKKALSDDEMLAEEIVIPSDLSGSDGEKEDDAPKAAKVAASSKRNPAKKGAAAKGKSSDAKNVASAKKDSDDMTGIDGADTSAKSKPASKTAKTSAKPPSKAGAKTAKVSSKPPSKGEPSSRTSKRTAAKSAPVVEESEGESD